MSPRLLWNVVATAILACALPASAGEIHDAVADGDVDRVTKLLQADPTLVSAPEDSPTQDLPLHTAAASGNIEIAKLLVNAGADIDGGDVDESTPLGVAAIRQQQEMVIFLLDAGADINRRDKHGSSPLSFAASGGNAEIVQLLMDRGADLNYVNQQGITLLHFAVTRNLTDLFDLLVERGDDINAGTRDGDTPLHWAAGRGNTEMVRRLLDNGADVNVANANGVTPLLQTGWSGDAATATLLLEAGVDPNQPDDQGTTPLYGAALGGHAELAEVLLKHGADVNIKTEEGETVLSKATESGSTAIVGELLTAGAACNVPEPRYGRGELHLAAVKGYRDIAEELLDNGAQVNAKDSGGNTPLDLALRYGNHGVAELLQNRGGAENASREALVPGAATKVDAGEAAVWYLGHSGWAVKTQSRLLVFDYWNWGRQPDEPGLCNGSVDPAELEDQSVVVFASHEHGDHYDPSIFGWRETVPDITYVLGCQPEDEVATDYVFADARQNLTVEGTGGAGDVRITTIESNDSGLGFMVEVDGVVILHPGDHANRQRDFSGPYKAEVDYLAAAGVKPDIAFLPISGCGFGDQEAVKLGAHYVLETLTPKVFVPMHSGGNSQRYREFIDDCQDTFPQIRMIAVENDGDHFRYNRTEAL